MVQEGTNDAPKRIAPQDIKIKFNVENQPLEVSLEDVNRLFADIDKYNDQFSLGSMMGRMIVSHLEPHIEPEEHNETQSPEGSLAEEDKNQQITAFFLISTHKKLLNNVGLSLKPVSGGAVITGEEGSATQGEIAINISDKDRFTSFLGALDPEQIKAVGLKDNLEKVPQRLSQQIMWRYNLAAPEQEAVELFGGMEKIIAEYKRLGMAESVATLENYFDHGMRGDLKEYVLIERRGLFSPPGKFFGPADWQIDTSPSGLEERWNEAIAILLTTRQNPKATGLYKNLLGHLQMCIDHALENLETLDYIRQEIKEKDRTILEAARQKLDMISQGTSQV